MRTFKSSKAVREYCETEAGKAGLKAMEIGVHAQEVVDKVRPKSKLGYSTLKAAYEEQHFQRGQRMAYTDAAEALGEINPWLGAKLDALFERRTPNYFESLLDHAAELVTLMSQVPEVDPAVYEEMQRVVAYLNDKHQEYCAAQEGAVQP